MSLFTKVFKAALIAGRDVARFAYNELLLRASPQLANAFYESLTHRQLCYLLGHGVLGRTNASFPWKITLKNGRPLHIAVNPYDRFSTGCAFDYKAHDTGLKRTQEFFLDRCIDRTLYLDIGANIGVSSIYALSQGIQCWLFEPNTPLHEFGRSLFSQNKFTRAHWESVALSDSPGEARFYVSRSSFLSSFDPKNAEREGNTEEIVVQKRTLDSYLEQIRGLADEIIVKIDVEGHEMQVLEGARQTFAHYRPAVMIELLGESDTRRRAWAWFVSFGYQGFGIFDEPDLRLLTLKSAEDLLSFADINFVFVPQNHQLLDELHSRA